MTFTKIIKQSLIAGAFTLSFGANASIINTTGEIIAAPTSVADDAPGAINTHIQGFDEIQKMIQFYNKKIEEKCLAKIVGKKFWKCSPAIC